MNRDRIEFPRRFIYFDVDFTPSGRDKGGGGGGEEEGERVKKIETYPAILSEFFFHGDKPFNFRNAGSAAAARIISRERNSDGDHSEKRERPSAGLKERRHDHLST